MNYRLWIVFGIVVLGIIGLAIWATTGGEKESPVATAEAVDWHKTVTKDNVPEGTSAEKAELIADRIKGKVDSDVVFIEWMNFQCSACQSLFRTIEDIYAEYSDRVAFVDRYLYLPGHPNGLAASVAAEAAARQGKYQEMYFELFSKADAWNNSTLDNREGIFRGFAEDIGLDIDKWTSDYREYETNGIKDRLDFQNNLGKQSDLTGTPYIMVNGENIKSNKDALTEALNKALNQAKQ